MVDTWSISNDQGWPRISFCFSNCFNSLVEVSTHGDLCYVYISIAHCDGSHIFLLSLFTTSCELCDSTCWCRFRRLSTCVGVNFCIEYHYVDVTSTCKNMVNTTEADIVSPSVTTEDPLGFLGQIVFLSKDLFSSVASTCFQSCDQFVCCCTVGCSNSECIQPFLASFFNCFVFAICYNSFNFCFKAITDSSLCKKHTITKLSVIFEQ